MKKLLLFIIIFLILYITPSLALTAYASCTEYGNYYLCTNGLPNPTLNFGEKGIVITGLITFISSSGTSSSPDAEDINLIYNVPGGIEIRDATISITSGTGATPADNDGGDGGTIDIEFVTDKFRMVNTILSITSGSGATGYTTDACSHQDGGIGGNILFNIDSPTILDNNNITISAGNGANGYRRTGCVDDYAGVNGANAGTIKVYMGISSNNNIINNTNLTYIGGNEGNGAVSGNNDCGCFSGGTSSSYTTNIYGNSYSYNFIMSNNLPIGGISDCYCTSASDSDSAYGAIGQNSENYFENITLINSRLTLKGTPSSDSLADCNGADRDVNGQTGGTVIINGTRLILNNSIITLISGNGGDADGCGTSDAASCGAGGPIKLFLDNLEIYDTSINYTLGVNGLTAGDDTGGNSGYVNISINKSLIANNNILTWTSYDGCVGDDVLHYVGGKGGSFYLRGGNVSIYGSRYNLLAKNSGTGYQGYGGVVTFNGDILTLSNSHINLTGGDSKGDDAHGGTFPGYGLISFNSVNITNSNVTLVKGLGTAVNLTAKFLTNGSGTSYFNNARIRLIGTFGLTTYFNISNNEVLFFNNTNLNYTGNASNWSVYTNYVYIDNATVNSQIRFYNRSSSIIRKYNASTTGIWNFTTASIDNTYAQYFSRINSVNISYNTVSPIKTTNLTCNASYILGNGSVTAIYEWYNNSVYKSSGVNYTSAMLEGQNITCSIRLYDTQFNNTMNTSTIIVYAYPYNLQILVNNLTIYNYSGIFNYTSNVGFDVGPINRYLQYVCTTTNCTVPISVITNVPISNLNITNLTFTYGVDSLATTDIYIPFIVGSDTSGIVNTTNVEFTLLSDEQTNILFVFRDTANGSTINYTQTVKDSKLNVTIVPNKVEYWDVYPYKPTQQDVTPFGQSSRIPIFNATVSATHNANLYIRFKNGTMPNCTRTTFNTNSTNALGYNINDTLKLVNTYIYYNNSPNTGIRSGGQSGSSFDNINDAINISDSSELRLTNGGTIIAWIYPLSSGGGTYGRIVDKSIDTTATNGYSLTLYAATNVLQFRVNAGTSTISTPSMTSGNNHVAVTFNGSGRNIYINGVDSTSSGGTAVDLPPNIAGLIAIGSRATSVDRSFNGSIYTVRIYNRSLTQTEITNDYALGPNSISTNGNGLVLQYFINKTESTYSNSTNIFDINALMSPLSLWTWTDFNCTPTSMKSYYPELDFKTRCVDCVNNTVDWTE